MHFLQSSQGHFCFFFHFFPFFVPVTFFHHHSLCPPATSLVLPSWENRKRVQASAVAPCDTASFLSFSPDVIWGIHSLATASFAPLLWVPLFLLASPEKSKSVLDCPISLPPAKASLKHEAFSRQLNKCFTRSVWDFKQHPSFVFVFCVCLFFFYQSKAVVVCRFLFTPVT